VTFSLPTGTGKGVLIGKLAHDLSAHGRVLVIAHRKELIEQLAEHCGAWCGAASVGVVMGECDERDKPVIVATIQTLRAKRLTTLLDATATPVATLIIDEYHHATADSYVRLMNVVTLHSPECVVIGCSATPYRADKSRLDDLFPPPIFERSIREMQDAGWLAPLVYERVLVPMELADMLLGKSSEGRDYEAGALALDTMRPDVIQALVEGTSPRIGQRIALAFCASVKHAQMVADAYTAAGIRSTAVYGDMPRDERARILGLWRTGEIQLVTNDVLLIEGFDFPELAALVLARPTASLVRYVQQIGRGARTSPGKLDCLVLEATPGRPDPRQVTLGDVDPSFADDLPHGGPRRPKIILLDPRQDGRFRFFSIEEHGCFVAPIDGDTSLWLVREPDATSSGLYRLAVKDEDVVYLLDDDPMPLYAANRTASDFLRDCADKKLAATHQRWHEQPATERQLGFIATRAPDLYGGHLTKGEASQIISLLIFSDTAPRVLRAVWPATETPPERRVAHG
jgi:hypothetical protein